MLVPVALKEGSTEALLVLGAELSEEPYSGEDTALVENVAGALALLLMRGSGMQAGRSFEECPSCGTCYDTGTTRCSRERTALVLVATPRMLAGRHPVGERFRESGGGEGGRAGGGGP